MPVSRPAQKSVKPSHKGRRLLLLAAAAVAVPACAYLTFASAPANLQSKQLIELSGLTRSLATPEWLWAMNDSGDTPRLFRTGLEGEDGGIVPVQDPTGAVKVENEDWEDIAAFRWQGEAALLIGDVGDNLNWRRFVKLYAVADPGRSGSSADLLWRLDVKFPDQPRDVEGIAVDPLNNDILLLSKRDRPPRLYRVAMPERAPMPDEAPVTAEFLGEVRHIPRPNPADLVDDPLYGMVRDWVTAFDISPDGRFAVVTTYKDAYRYNREPGEGWAAAVARKPELVNLPQFQQTEAGGISADGETFYAGSEKLGGFVAVPLR